MKWLVRMVSLFLLVAVFVVPQTAPMRLLSQDKPDREEKKEVKVDESNFVDVTDEIRKSIDKGLEYLVKIQNQRKDGAFGSSQYLIAEHSVACLAFLAAGNTPERGKYSKNLTKGLQFILKCVNKDGYVTTGGDSSGMYGQGYATQFLAEVSGTIRDETLAKEVRTKLKKAARCIENVQNRFGGWNGSPDPLATDDGSGAVAIMQVTALRAARNAGVLISEKTVSKATKYLLEMTDSQGWYQYNYNSRGGHRSAALTGAGMSMLNALGLQENEKVKKGITNLLEGAPFLGKPANPSWNPWYYYTAYYSSLAIFQNGESWGKWYRCLSQDIIKRQSPEGGWVWGGYGTNALATGYMLLVLTMPYRYLPYFQEGGKGASGY